MTRHYCVVLENRKDGNRHTITVSEPSSAVARDNAERSLPTIHGRVVSVYPSTTETPIHETI